MESLTPEVAPFGIRTMLVEPWLLPNRALTAGSTTYAEAFEAKAKTLLAQADAHRGLSSSLGFDAS